MILAGSWFSKSFPHTSLWRLEIKESDSESHVPDLQALAVKRWTPYLTALHVVFFDRMLDFLFFFCFLPVLLGKAKSAKLLLLALFLLVIVQETPFIPVNASNDDCFFCSADSCWISSTPAFLGSFCAPLALVLLMNCTIFLAVLRVFGLRKNSKLKKSGNKKKSKTLRAIVSLSFLMGITWVFGLFLLATDHDALQYIFAILNSLQGFFVFVFFASTSRREEGRSQKTVRRHSSDGSRSGDYRGSSQRISQAGTTTVVSLIADTLRRRLSTTSRENANTPDMSVSLDNSSRLSSVGDRNFGSLTKHGSLPKNGSLSKHGSLSKNGSLSKRGSLSKYGSLSYYRRATRRSVDIDAAKSEPTSLTALRSQSLTDDPPRKAERKLFALPPRRRQPERVLRNIYVEVPQQTGKPFSSTSFSTSSQSDTLKEAVVFPGSDSTTYAVCKLYEEPGEKEESIASLHVNPIAFV